MRSAKRTSAWWIVTLMAACFRCAAAPPATAPTASNTILEEMDNEHDRRLTATLSKDAQFARDWQNAAPIYQNVQKLISDGNLKDALGEERAYIAAVGPTMQRDARSAEIQFVLDTLCRLGEDDAVYDVFLLELGAACIGRAAPGDFERAERYLTISVRGFEESSHGRANIAWARAAHNLGTAQLREGNITGAVATLRRSLALMTESIGRGSEAAQCENDFGEALREWGQAPAEAMQHLNAAAAWIKDARAQGDSAELQDGAAIIFHNLALLSLDMGEIQRGRAFELQALPLTAAVIQASKNTPLARQDMALRARILRQLGVLPLLGPNKPPSREKLAELRAAENYLREAVSLYEQSLGHNHPETVLGRMSLGMVCASYGNFKDATAMVESATRVDEPAEPQILMDLLRLWSTLALTAGQYDVATEATNQWIALSTQMFGSSNLFSIGANYNLATIQADTHQFVESERTFRGVLKNGRRAMDLAFASQQERRQLATEAAFRNFLDGYLSLKKMQAWKGDGGYGEVLSWKGAVLAHQIAIGRTRTIAPHELEGINEATQRISALTLEQARDQSAVKNDANWKARQQDRWNKIEKLNDEIEQSIGRISGLDPATSSMDTAALQKILPEKCALVDFVEYANRDERDANGHIFTSLRYVAYVVRSNTITPIDLGDAEAVDKAVTVWTVDRCRDPKAGLEARKLIWDKLAPALEDVKLILISPDASLGNVPFGALPDGDGSYLIERYAFTSVAVPQLLPGLLQHPAAIDGNALLLSAEVQKPGNPIKAPIDSMWARQARLTYAATEIEEVGQSLAEAQIPFARLVGPDASKSEFRRVIASASLLHYAGHAFFDPTLRQVIDSQFQSAAGQGIIEPAPMDASLLCGLVLAPDEAHNDLGELTAYEIARMDLHNLNLVVLSGCNTAQGESAGGEGLLSLQRACQIAGAHTVIASLWPVQDEVTQRLMKYFYAELLAAPRSRTLPLIALRRAQLRVMREAPPERHTVSIVGPPLAVNSAINRALPAVWAPWVLSGSPGDLQEIVKELERETH